ncbi:unnamed protein product [Adineta ricciae]|uniref:Nuclear receptor domain-containing protein n=2 Tax=Adineta ricciae TaxID=249248 RepID=A0A813T775_ADIRI|nr:unnamed protein product [Adineta ricciae]
MEMQIKTKKIKTDTPASINESIWCYIEQNKMSLNRPVRPPKLCLVCDDFARGMNFDVLTCMSCKAFFRRHAAQAGKELRCLLNSDCIITQQTRGACSACRLKKCLALGMNPALIRSSPKKLKNTTQSQLCDASIEEKQIVSLPQPTTLSLLAKDKSTLTFDEWNLLSNVIHAYDEKNVITAAQKLLREQASLPVKIRAKKMMVFELIGTFFSAVKPFLYYLPHFHSLSFDVRRVLIENNLNGMGALNAMFGAYELKLFGNDSHVRTCYEIYGEEYVKESERLANRSEQNGTLVKMFLTTLAFSTNCSVVEESQITTSTNTSVTSSIALTRIQDVFIIMLWKYLVYQYGYLGAVRHLDHLVKFYLDILNRLNELNSKEHKDMINVIIDQTIHSLTLDD